MKAFQRRYKRVDEDRCEVIVGDIAVIVPEHPFWSFFAGGWEPDTERIYRGSVKPGDTVVDLGAWIGPTLLFALACGAGRIIALEPNPKNHAEILEMLDLNPGLAKTLTVLNQAAGPEKGVLSMGLAEGDDDTSTSGIMGDDFDVESTTIRDLYRDFEIQRTGLVKIDIEGAEALLEDDFRWLSKQPGQTIHLSIHVPFFPENTNKSRLADAFQGFHIEDDRGQTLPHEAFRQRLLSTSSKPEWGTQHGNFFEVSLRAKD